jgi:hypothetical protein
MPGAHPGISTSCRFRPLSALVTSSRPAFSNGAVPHGRNTGYPEVVFHSRAESDFAADTRNSALPARGCFLFLSFRPFGGSNVGMQPLVPRPIKRLADHPRSTDASKCGQAMVQITGATGRDSGECQRTNPRAESRLGVPRKQNGGKRRARLGIYPVKRSCARENKKQKWGTANESSQL